MPGRPQVYTLANRPAMGITSFVQAKGRRLGWRRGGCISTCSQISKWLLRQNGSGEWKWGHGQRRPTYLPACLLSLLSVQDVPHGSPRSSEGKDWCKTCACFARCHVRLASPADLPWAPPPSYLLCLSRRLGEPWHLLWDESMGPNLNVNILATAALAGRAEWNAGVSVTALCSSFKRKVTAPRVRRREMTIFNQAAGVEGGGGHTSVRGLVKVAAREPRGARNWSVQIIPPYPALPKRPCWQNRHKCEKPTGELNMTPVRLSSGMWRW